MATTSESMLLLSANQDLSNITNVVYYRTTVSYLPDRMGLDIKLFETMDISKQFYIDTGYCVTRKKTFNRIGLYDTFVEYTNLTADQVKASVLKELSDNQDWYERAGIACLGMRGIKFDKWFKKLKSK